MRAIAAGVTDVGRERNHNEDRFVLLPEFGVFVVADGMGGHQCGEVASRMATSTIASYFRQARQSGALGELLRDALLAANDRIHQRANNSSTHRGMGTTVVAAAFHRKDGELHIAHAGDSRCYRLRDGDFVQLTRDHSLVEEALRSRPDITKSELAYLPANVITRALGVEASVDVESTTSGARPGDLFLLCSDGLHGFVTDERIAEILRADRVLTDGCAELIAEANGNGGGDNITAVLVRIEEPDEPWAAPSSERAAQRAPRETPVPSSGGARTPDPDATLQLTPPPRSSSDVDADSAPRGKRRRKRKKRRKPRPKPPAEDSGVTSQAGDSGQRIQALTEEAAAELAGSTDPSAAIARIGSDDTAQLETVSDAAAVLADLEKESER